MCACWSVVVLMYKPCCRHAPYVVGMNACRPSSGPRTTTHLLCFVLDCRMGVEFMRWWEYKCRQLGRYEQLVNHEGWAGRSTGSMWHILVLVLCGPATMLHSFHFSELYDILFNLGIASWNKSQNNGHSSMAIELYFPKATIFTSINYDEGTQKLGN